MSCDQRDKQVEAIRLDKHVPYPAPTEKKLINVHMESNIKLAD
jgi:hypothetical protein